MDFLEQKNLSGELVPILLGCSMETVQAAHRLYRLHNVVSHVFCNKVPLPMRLSFCMKYHVVHSTKGERLLLFALEEFGERLEQADVIPYLIPCSDEYASFVWEHREELERRFVIADRKEAYRVQFGDSLPAQKGGAKT